MTNKDGIRSGRSPPFEVLKLLIISKLSEENKMENKAYTTYTWHTATGDVTEELSEFWAGILANLDRGDYNNDHKQFRDARRCGTELSDMEEKMISDSFDLEQMVLEKDREQEIRKKLTARQAEVLDALLSNDGDVTKAAKDINMKRSIVRKHRKIMQKKLYDDFHPHDEADDKRIGENLKKLRERYGITGAEMAEYLEINCRKYYRYESGESSIPRDTVELLSELFEVSRYEIIAFKHSF